MAKDILITPGNGTIDFDGGNNPSQGTIYLEVENDGAVTFKGVSGQLLKISNTTENSIFKVIDDLGQTVFDVWSNNNIYIPNNDGKLFFGSTSSASIWSSGTDLTFEDDTLGYSVTLSELLSGGNGVHNDLAGLQGGNPSADEFYHLTFNEQSLISRFDEDSSGLTFDGNPIGDSLWTRIGSTLYTLNDGDNVLIETDSNFYLGSGKESRIYFDGTDLNIEVELISIDDILSPSPPFAFSNINLKNSVSILGNLSVSDNIFLEGKIHSANVSLEIRDSGMFFTDSDGIEHEVVFKDDLNECSTS